MHQNPTGRRQNLDNEFDAILRARLNRAKRACFGTDGLTPDEEQIVRTIHDAFVAEALPELSTAAYRILGVPQNSVCVRVNVDPDGLAFKGANIVGRFSTPDEASTILDLRRLRGQMCELYSLQTEIEDGGGQSELFGEEFPETPQHAESFPPMPEDIGSEVEAGASDPSLLYNIIMPDGATLNPEPVSEETAEAIKETAAEDNAIPEADITGLTESQERAAAMLRDGVDEAEVLAHLGITRPTLKRWAKLPAFVAAATPED